MPEAFGMRGTSYGPNSMDPLKAMLAQTIQHYLVTEPAQPELPEPLAEVKSITGFAIGPSEVRLRVRMENDTYRTFTITIRENR